MNKTLGILIGLAVASLPLSAQAHRSWIKPSAAQVEGKAPWVTIDAAVSESLFDFDAFPLKLDGLSIIGPDGKPVTADAPSSGHLRSTFDLQLTQPGTYRIAVVSQSVMGSYTLGTETKRFRGTEDDVKAIPADVKDLKVSRMASRFETFVTSGKANDVALQPTGKGLELVPVTHPSDLVAGEAATFRFLLDGQPLAKLNVTVIPGGVRFRNNLKESQVVTNDAGEAVVTWPMAGEYLITASYPPRAPMTEGAKPEGEGQGGGQGGGGMGGAGGPPREMPALRLSYSGTFEVLPN